MSSRLFHARSLRFPHHALRLLLLLLGLLAMAVPAAAQVPFAAPSAEGAEEPVEAADEPSVAEALRLLAIVLDEPAARSALVEQLRAAEEAVPAPRDGGPATVDAAADPPPLIDPTVPQIIAGETLEIAEGVTQGVSSIFGELLALGEILTVAQDYDFAAAWDAVLPVLTVIVIVLVSVWLLRLALRRVLWRFEGQAEAAQTASAPWRWKLAGLLVEVIPVILAWSIGYGVSLAAGSSDIDVGQRAFLSAFLAVEVAQIVLRFVFRPHQSRLRLLRVSDATARHWRFWLGRIVGILGYGLLFVGPLADLLGAQLLGGWLRLAAVIVSMLMTMVLVLRNRVPVRDGLEKRLAASRGDMIVTWLTPLAHYWHLIAIGYIVALFIVWRAVPGNAVAFMVRATASSAVVILLGSLFIALLTRTISGGIKVSDSARRSFPLLESRLNRMVPAALQVVRVVSALVVIAAILSFWGIFDVPSWLGTPGGRRIIWSFSWIAGVLLLAGAAWLLVSSWIEYRLNPDVGTAPSPRERTLLALFSNAFVVFLGILTAMTVLTEIGINVAPLLAGAGVVGLAIGFGAQKLVQDIINGAFIQLENTMNEGDVVTAGNITGVVERLTIRSVSLRDLNGHYHMIPFSSVDTVTNFMKGFSFHVADISVAYRENTTVVKAAMFEAFDRLMETEHRANILPPLEMQGIVAFLDSGITMRARIKTLPGQQWATGRAYSELLKEVFDEKDIEIPFPHRTLYMGIGKDGAAPPLNVHTTRPPRRPEAGGSVTGGGIPANLSAPDAGLIPPAPANR